MKWIAVAVALVIAFAAPASARSTYTITQHGHTLVVADVHGNMSIKAAPKGTVWAVEDWSNTPVLVPDTSMMIADNFSQGFLRDASGNLDVNIAGGGVLTLPYNGTGAEAQKNASALAVVTGDSGGVATFSSLTNDGSSAKNLNININAQSLGVVKTQTSSAASGGWKYTVLDFSGATTPQNVKTGAGTIEEVSWVCASAMTSTTTLEVWDSTSNSNNRIFFGTFLSGGFKSWGPPGLAVTLGIEVDVSAVTTQSTCKVLVAWQ